MQAKINFRLDVFHPIYYNREGYKKGKRKMMNLETLFNKVKYYKRFFGVNSIQYKTALATYDKAFNAMVKSSTVKGK